jgi:hypothetical protein
MITWAKLIIGSNVIMQTSAAIMADGEVLIEIEYPDDQIVVTTTIRDDAGDLVAKLRHNKWDLNDASYEVSLNPASLTLTDHHGAVALEAIVYDSQTVEVRRARLLEQACRSLSLPMRFRSVASRCPATQ